MADDLRPPWRIQFDTARDPYSARNALGITTTGGGGGGGAPDSAEYIVAAADATLTAERVATNTATITWDFTTPGQARANAVTGGGGNVSNVGTPTLGQYAKWTTATTIQGVAPATVLSDIGAQPAGSYQPLDADLTAIAALTGIGVIYYRSAADTWTPVTVGTGLSFTAGTLANTVSTAGSQPLDSTLTALAAYNTNGLLTQTAADTFTGRTLTGPAAGITVSNGNGVAGNPTLALADDLAALEALAGTNTIYYRSGTSAWTAVVVGSGLTFTGGTLAATATGGGNVSNSGTPVAGQVAEWVTATTIQGVSTYAKLASPTFTGDPKAPTPTAGDNDTSIATTAFVTTAVAAVPASVVGLKLTTYTAGAGTHTLDAKCIAYVVELVGGGGGGSAGGAASAAAGAGGNTTYGSLSVNGGGGGQGAYGGTPGGGGTGGIMKCEGIGGHSGGYAFAGANHAAGGAGGAGPWGGSGRAYIAGAGENASAGSGSGGGGGSMSNAGTDYAGGGGGSGGYCRFAGSGALGGTPVSYSVGAGGAGSGATVFGSYAGGSGGSGIIIVTEYLKP